MIDKINIGWSNIYIKMIIFFFDNKAKIINFDYWIEIFIAENTNKIGILILK